VTDETKTGLLPRGFAQVETWVFDLDNTLYPHSVDVWKQVNELIRNYIANYLGVSPEEATRIQKDYYLRYGTSMRGMMAEHNMPHEEYLEAVHMIDHTLIAPNPALGAAIEKLPGRKLILTNGTRKHADAIVARLGLHGHFEDTFDIVAADLEPKPARQTYDKFLRVHGVKPQRAAMFEDLARNLEVPHALGMTTTLIVPPAGFEPPAERTRLDWENAGRDAPFVDHVTDDLAAFIEGIAAAMR
jgi:putative hydrolase of the HAD superfamily